MNDFYIMQKKVDKSVLYQGMTIPQIFHEVFYNKIGFRLRHGESTQVPVNLNGTIFHVKMINQGFDQEKYKGHGDVLQIRYDSDKQFLEKA